jgi:hypothetical protein
LRSGVLRRRDHGGVKLAFDALQVRRNGRRERCSTTLSTAGGYVVAVTSVLSDRSVALASSYLADLTAGQTAVSHLRLVPGRPSDVDQRVLGRLASCAHTRGCLLDHASELRDLLAELTGAEVTIDVDDAALQLAAEAWAQREM